MTPEQIMVSVAFLMAWGFGGCCFSVGRAYGQEKAKEAAFLRGWRAGVEYERERGKG